MANLAVKYRPKTFEDVTEQSLVVSMVKAMCESPTLDNRNFLFVGSAGCGKAQPLDSKVLTPDGYIQMKDVKVGTKVYTHTGAIAEVSGVFPQGVRPVYEIILSDDTSIKVSDEHLNLIITYDHLKKEESEIRVVTTNDLLDMFMHKSIYEDLRIPVCSVADGIFGSRYDRVNLLRRLMSDFSKYNAVAVWDDVESEELALVARSLGIVDIVQPHEETVRKSENGEWKTITQKGHLHALQFPTNIGKLLGLSCSLTQKPVRTIVTINRIEDQECQCIYVDHEDHTYISDDFIPTHNTTIARILANELNDGKGEPIEIDAASHNGVDDVREIIRQAESYPVGQNYKVFICDECFPGDHWISTPSGKVQIKDIQEGDSIYNLTGTATVSKVFHNRVKTQNLISITLNGNKIFTTKDHLFFTDDGWVRAVDLQKGDVLYDIKTMQTMRKGILSSRQVLDSSVLLEGMQIQSERNKELNETFNTVAENVSNMWRKLLDTSEHRCKDLLNEMFCSLETAESRYGKVVGATCKTLAYVYLSDLWQGNGDSEQRSSDSLLTSMCFETDVEGSCEADMDKYLCGMWEFIHSRLSESNKENLQQCLQMETDSIDESGSQRSGKLSSHETSQSDVRSGSNSKDDRDEIKEWNITQSACESWWEWALHSSADDVARSSWSGVDIRVSCENRVSDVQSAEISYELQTRPSLSRITARSRGGWCRTQCEIASIARREKGDASRKFRVDSVEVYKPGDNERLFSSSFEDTELHSDYVDMYDLEIEGHPSYYVNDVLVHNCHSFSTNSWQIFLKTIEEPPAKSIFAFCTTNPEKIPATILSRVQTFQLSKISLDGIHKRLKYVVEQENAEGRGITYTDDAINFIAKLANGGMRDALTLLDKALAYSKELTLENLAQALNLPNYDDYFALLNAYAKKDNTAIAEIIDRVYNSGVNFIKWFEGFHSFIINVVKYIFLQDIQSTMIPSYYQDKIAKYSTAHATICLKLANKLLNLCQDLKSTQYLQEVALTYLCAVPKKEG